jgi:hypothetical protein
MVFSRANGVFARAMQDADVRSIISKPGDAMVLDRASGAGMRVRCLLPRPK